MNIFSRYDHSKNIIFYRKTKTSAQKVKRERSLVSEFQIKTKFTRKTHACSFIRQLYVSVCFPFFFTRPYLISILLSSPNSQPPNPSQGDEPNGDEQSLDRLDQPTSRKQAIAATLPPANKHIRAPALPTAGEQKKLFTSSTVGAHTCMFASGKRGPAALTYRWRTKFPYASCNWRSAGAKITAFARNNSDPAALTTADCYLMVIQIRFYKFLIPNPIL